MHCSIEIRKKRTLNRNYINSCSIDKLFASLLSVFTNKCDDQASVNPFFCKMDLALWYIFEHSGPHDRLQLFHDSGSPEQVKRFSQEQSSGFLYRIQIYQLASLFRDLPFLLQARLIKYKQFICRETMRYEAKPFVSNVDHPSPYILFIRSQAIPKDQHLLDQRRLASSNLPLSVSYLCWLEQQSSSKLTQQSRTVP